MLMSKADRTAIFELLFKEGVLTAEKKLSLPEHPELPGVRNLHVIKACQSLRSRGFVREQFAWRHYYWYLTNTGIEYLREFLHLPIEIVPATLKKRRTAPTRPLGAAGGRPRSDRDIREGDRDSYRHGGAEGEKKIGAGADFNPQFRGGYGGAAREGGRGRGFGNPSGSPAGFGNPSGSPAGFGIPQ